MNLLTKQGPRFCADAVGANGTKSADAGRKFKAVPDVLHDPREMARQIARELVSPIAETRLAAVDAIKDDPRRLAWVHDNTLYADVRTKTIEYIRALLSKNVAGVLDLRAHEIAVETENNLVCINGIFERLDRAVILGECPQNWKLLRIIVRQSLDSTAIEIAVNGLIGAKGDGLKIRENVDALVELVGRTTAQPMRSVAHALGPYVVTHISDVRLLTFIRAASMNGEYIEAAVVKIETLKFWFEVGFENMSERTQG
ncbi:MAG: hypothetical protein WC589_25055 [Sphingobacterium sp.]